MVNPFVMEPAASRAARVFEDQRLYHNPVFMTTIAVTKKWRPARRHSQVLQLSRFQVPDHFLAQLLITDLLGELQCSGHVLLRQLRRNLAERIVFTIL
ncbi:MAG: hypothetical protein AAB692_03960, partial [Patescibacteria group bacterium]